MSNRRRLARAAPASPPKLVPGPGIHVATLAHSTAGGRTTYEDVDGRPRFSGVVGYTIIESGFVEGHPLHGVESARDGSPGAYRVIFVLGFPGISQVQRSHDFDAVLAAGDSLLSISADVEFTMRVGSVKMAVWAHRNSHGRIGHVSLEFDAPSLTAAHESAHDFVMPLLSRWSFKHDVALTAVAVQVMELSTESKHHEMMLLGRIVPMTDLGPVTGDVRVLELIASYRDGSNSLDPFFQALSFFKVIEGAYKLRAARKTIAGEAWRDPGERLPTAASYDSSNDPDLPDRGYLQPFFGSKFTEVRDRLRTNVRHAVAHFDVEEPFLSDSRQHVLVATQAVPVLRYMARKLLIAEESGHAV